MADVSDVQDAIVTAIDGIRVAASAQWMIARGYPIAAVLDAAMTAGQVLVTVYQRDGYNRITTRFPNKEMTLPGVPPTLTVQVAGSQVIFDGLCTPDQVAGVKTSAGEFTTRCPYQDTPAGVAARLAAAGAGVAAGATLIEARPVLAALVVRDGHTVRPTRQQDVGLTVTVWAESPGQRDDAVRAIDAGLSDDGFRFLPLADGTSAWQRSAGSRQTDRAEAANIYRNDLYLTCEYSTTILAVYPVAIFPHATVNPTVTAATASVASLNVIFNGGR